MAKCKNCKNMGYAEDDEKNKYPWCIVNCDCTDIDIERDCEGYETMTNADRIRNMTDVEIARFIGHAQADRVRTTSYGQKAELPFGESEWLKWLQSPVEV